MLLLQEVALLLTRSCLWGIWLNCIEHINLFTVPSWQQQAAATVARLL
jgi:hypothetical protein